MKLLTNYHTHTYRCGHAYGQDEEYVLSAIKRGVKVLGFTDHIPFPHLTQKGIRPNVEDIEGYVQSILSLKEKYKDIIDIHLGYEMEYIPEFDEYYRSLLFQRKIEYFILGQHCYLDEDKLVFYNLNRNSLTNLDNYINAVLQAIDSGLIAYIAHPDLILNSFDIISDEVLNKLEVIIIKCKEKNIPLEVNMGGLRYYDYHRTDIDDDYSKMYPYKEFFKLVKKHDVPVIVGVDAHDPNDFFKEKYFDYIESFIKELDLKVIDYLLFKN